MLDDNLSRYASQTESSVWVCWFLLLCVIISSRPPLLASRHISHNFIYIYELTETLHFHSFTSICVLIFYFIVLLLTIWILNFSLSSLFSPHFTVSTIIHGTGHGGERDERQQKWKNKEENEKSKFELRLFMLTDDMCLWKYLNDRKSARRCQNELKVWSFGWERFGYNFTTTTWQPPSPVL